VTPAPAASGWSGGTTAPKVALTGVHANRVEYSWDTTAGPWLTYTAPLSTTAGVRTLFYRGEDDFGLGEVGSKVVKWDPTAPVLSSLTVPKFASDVSKVSAVTIKWGGTDSGGSGVAGYDVEYKIGSSGAWKSWKSATGATSALFGSSAGNTYYFRARTIDRAGNKGAFSAAKSVVIPRDQGAMKFSKGWSTKKGTSLWKGSAKYTSRKGASASFKYTGKDVYLLVTKSANRGRFRVYVNGTYVRTIDTRSSTYKARQMVLVKSYSSSKTRTVKIVNSATRGRARIDIDGLAYRR